MKHFPRLHTRHDENAANPLFLKGTKGDKRKKTSRVKVVREIMYYEMFLQPAIQRRKQTHREGGAKLKSSWRRDRMGSEGKEKGDRPTKKVVS